METSKIDRIRESHPDYTERRLKNLIAKKEAQELAERNQKPVKSITINIEWKKSRMWGHNPNAEACIEYHDGTYGHSDGYTASGCGYDKESTVIAEIFNAYLKYKLWNMEEDTEKHKTTPYGISLSYDYSPHYNGGVGTSCYYRIAEFIGGKLEHTANGKTFDVYIYKEGGITC